MMARENVSGSQGSSCHEEENGWGSILKVTYVQGHVYYSFQPPPFPLKEMVWVGPGVSYFSGYK